MQGQLLRWLWFARMAWIALPLTAGTALADMLDERSSPVAISAATLCWVSWGSGLVGLLAPRPWGLTVVRVVAPIAVVLGIAAAFASADGVGALAAGTTLFAAALALGPPVAQAAGNALAYGDELRFPLRIPTPLLGTAVPLAVACVAGGIASGPLLAAAGAPLAAILAAGFGFPLAAFLFRSLHTLSRRWLVFVPAGVAIADPLMLLDAVLIRRAAIARFAPASRVLAPGTVDLRLGTARGVLIEAREVIEFGRRRGRSGGTVVRSAGVVVAPVRQSEVLRVAQARRIRTDPTTPTSATTQSSSSGRAMPPPSTTSPS
ncbi:MAG: hypothetical protein ACT4OX_02710 [Actinomycetota bacterium]